MRFIKPIDAELVLKMAASHELLVTLDENTIVGGAGGAVTEALAEHGVAAQVLHIGLPDRFIQHGAREDMLREAGLDVPQMEAAIKARWAFLQKA
jgi:1-deoxy-D-xylulose-5-phosphate synthase